MKEFRDENEDCCTNVVFGDINCLGARDADFQCLGRGDGARGTPVSAKRVATIDKRGARNVGMIDKRRAAIGEATTSCYALRFLRRFATGILEIGSRSERIAARVARIVATIDKRRAAIGEATTSCYALHFLRRFATGILEIGSRSERIAARVARNVATIDKRARGSSG